MPVLPLVFIPDGGVAKGAAYRPAKDRLQVPVYLATVAGIVLGKLGLEIRIKLQGVQQVDEEFCFFVDASMHRAGILTVRLVLDAVRNEVLS